MEHCLNCQQLINLIACLQLEADLLRKKIRFLEKQVAIYEDAIEPEQPREKKRKRVGFNTGRENGR